MVTFKDPSGNIIDLYQLTPEKVLEMAQKMKEQEPCCGAKEDCCKN